jgi:hypothetical protein
MKVGESRFVSERGGFVIIGLVCVEWSLSFKTSEGPFRATRTELAEIGADRGPFVPLTLQPVALYSCCFAVFLLFCRQQARSIRSSVGVVGETKTRIRKATLPGGMSCNSISGMWASQNRDLIWGQLLCK